jgi:hypothetical protein
MSLAANSQLLAGMNSNDIKQTINEGRPAGDPTGVVHQLGRIWIIGLLALLVIGGHIFSQFTGRDAGNDGMMQPQTSQENPPSKITTAAL